MNHRTVGLGYALASMLFLLVGFSLMLVMRWQLAFPGQPLPLIGAALFPGGVMAPEVYNAFGAMHGTIMIFLGVVPLATGGFGIYLTPLLVGARDMAFPRLSGWAFGIYLAAGVTWLISFLVPGGAAASGWTSYPPLSVISNNAQTYWLVGMLGIIVSSILSAVNMIVTVVQSRTSGDSYLELPILAWAQLVSAFLLLLAFPPLAAASVLQLMDRVVGTSFFLPSGLVVSGEALQVSGGGNPLLWQHLFWFLAHPEVYVLILPAAGIVGEIFVVYTKKPLYGYRTLVYSMIALGFLSFLVWAHHMFLTGMGTTLSSFFQLTTLIISVPSVVMLTTYLLTLHGASIQFSVPMLFALAFLPMFGIGGLSGIPLGLAASDIHLHDTYYVIGHFHYLVAPGTLFALMGGVYHWYPLVTGRHMNVRLGKIHFWSSLVCMNGVFFPMFLMGLAGVSRRLYDQTVYSHGRAVQPWNVVMSVSAWALFVAQLPFLYNMAVSWRRGERVEVVG